MSIEIKIVRLANGANLDLPQYATLGSAGMDLYAAIDKPIKMISGNIELIPTGIAIALPFGYEAQVRPRSGLAAKHGLTVLNTPGTVDSDYRGEIKIILINHSKEDYVVEPGTRVAQLVIAKYEKVVWHEVSILDNTGRGEDGFGSTGK